VTVFECGPNKRRDAKVGKLYQLHQLHLNQKKVAKKKVIEIPPSTPSTSLKKSNEVHSPPTSPTPSISPTSSKNNESNEIHFF
jgi:hypothetical protein